MKSISTQIVLLSLIAFLMLPFESLLAQSQWSTTSDGSGLYYNQGPLGIGTSDPERTVHIRGNNAYLRVDRNEYQAGFLMVRYDQSFTNVLGSFGSGTTVDPSGNPYFFITDFGLKTKGENQVRFIVDKNGSVNIGGNNTIVPAGYKLSVEGKVICEELRVKLQSEWPDYVFDDSYTLMPLAEVSDYIQTNKHLPGLPTAGEMEGGVAVGEMNRLLVEKVEELTLYAIEAEKENEALQNDLSSLKAEIEMLKAMINK